MTAVTHITAGATLNKLFQTQATEQQLRIVPQ